MNTNNAYQMYLALISEKRYKPKSQRERMQELATALLNRGRSMRKRKPGAPPTALISSPQGRKTRSDAKKQFKCMSPQGRNHPQTPRTPQMH